MVFEKMREALASQFDIDIETITRQTDIIEDLEADSLDLVELIMILEEEYNIELLDDAINEKRTIGEIADYVESIIN